MEPAATRKAQLVNALKKNDNDSNLYLAFAKVFWVERKAEKIKKWLQNSITLDKDNGDAWAHFYLFETEFGTKESQLECLEKFKEAEPHHGELWNKEAKKVENWRKDPCEILKIVAKNIQLYDAV